MNPLQKLAAIADEYDKIERDGLMTPRDEIIFYSSRDGKILLTLEDCFDARNLLKKPSEKFITQPSPDRRRKQ